MNRINKVFLLGIAVCAVLPFFAEAETQISGELKKWHKVTLTFDGPEVSETDKENPFMDYRLNVTFSHKESGKKYVVPGYFAADGDAGNTSAIKGNKWRAHFSPDETGSWVYSVEFRKGQYSAVSTRKQSGKSAEFMDGEKGSFDIGPTDKTGSDFRARGRLEYVGEHYLKLAETGEWFLKTGPDAPENFLSYVDFDGTFQNDGIKDDLVKTWEAHLKDYRKGDPSWKGGKGKAIIGALNYLASEGLNSVSFLTMNVGGDDCNVFPYVDYNTFDRIDVSKMDQWEVVFCHAQQLGLFLHFKLMEHENQGLLDGAAVGANTKLYYREIIARFGHHLALNWNVCEESGEWGNMKTPPQMTEERLACAQKLYEIDPYHHHIVIHNGNPFDDLLGPESKYTGVSLQTNKKDFSRVHGQVWHWRNESIKAGKKWAVSCDEPGDASFALAPDESDPEGINHKDARGNALWGTFMAGGWGVEWYFGYKLPHSDLTCQDYRSRDRFWDYNRILLEFFANNDVPYWEMQPNDDLVSAGYCLAKAGEVYLAYVHEGGTVDFNLPGGDYTVKWFNPRTGGELQNGSLKEVSGGDTNVGNAPSDPELDWVVLVRKK